MTSLAREGLFLFSPIPIWIYEPKTLRILDINEAAAKTFGYGRESLLSANMAALFVDNETRHSQIWQPQKTPSDSPNSRTAEVHFRSNDGQVVQLKVVVSSIAYDRRSQGLVMGVNVSEQKRANERMRFAEERFGKLFYNSMIAKAIVRLSDGRIIDVNTSYSRLVGESRDKIIGHTTIELGYIAEPAERDEILRNFGVNGFVHRHELQYRTKQSGLRTVLTSVEAIQYNDQECILSSLVDITDRKRVEKDLLSVLETEKRLGKELTEANWKQQFLLNASALLAETSDFNLTLRKLAQSAVPAIADWCSVQMADEQGKLSTLAVAHPRPDRVQYVFDLARKFPPEPGSESIAERALRSGKSEAHFEIPDEMIVKAARSEEHLSILRSLGFKSSLTVPICSSHRQLGVITLVMSESDRRFTPETVLLVEDLARRAALFIENALLFRKIREMNVQLETRVKERTAELESSNKELEAFSYSVSHDLRAPLRHLSGFVQLLSERSATLLDENGRHYLDVIASASRKMGVLIDDLLSFSRMGRSDLRMVNVDLSETVKAVATQLTASNDGRLISWVIGPLPTVRADPSMIELVFENLLSNAVKFTRLKEVTRIEVGARSESERHVLYVRDNGTGFNMRYADKLFKVFQRLHSQEEFEGTGIGLANVQRIIQRHGGGVWAESAEGEGATFFISLPRTIEEVKNE